MWSWWPRGQEWGAGEVRGRGAVAQEGAPCLAQGLQVCGQRGEHARPVWMPGFLSTSRAGRGREGAPAVACAWKLEGQAFPAGGDRPALPWSEAAAESRDSEAPAAAPVTTPTDE